MAYRYDRFQANINDFSEERKNDISEFIKYAKAMAKIDFENAKKEIEEEKNRRL